MAIKSTIYKAVLHISDMDRHYYIDHSLTIACHPSETEDRLMMRILAFALNSRERLEFANGLTESDEPDLWEKDLTGAIQLWVQVGQPDEKNLLKACGRAKEVVIYSYNQSPTVWWEKSASKMSRAKNLSVYMVSAKTVDGLAKMADRFMDLQFSIQDGEIYVHGEDSTVTVQMDKLN